MKTYCSLIVLLLASFVCHGQRSFTMGGKVGYGTSAFRMNATLTSDSSSKAVRSGAIISAGFMTRYALTNSISIESGVCANDYSFYLKDKFRARDAFWKTNAKVNLFDFQIPLLINYRLTTLRHPSIYFIVSGGTTFDSFMTYSKDIYSFTTYPIPFQNLAGSFKTGRSKNKEKIEIGIEVQYSLKYFHSAGRQPFPFEGSVYSRLNMVSINFSYFFYKSVKGKGMA